MNKKTKGLVSLAAGAALMFGGAGTFALWFDTAAFGAGDSAIVTGQLDLADAQDGLWRWDQVSHPDSIDLIDAAFDPDADTLVPGDALRYAWNDDEDAAANLVGTTIVASLYLRGKFITPAELYPLVLLVGATPVIGDDGAFVIWDAVSDGDDLTLPTVYLQFPALPLPGIAPGEANPVGDGVGYGRDEQFLFSDIQNLELVLQQVVDGDYAGSEG